MRRGHEGSFRHRSLLLCLGLSIALAPVAVAQDEPQNEWPREIETGQGLVRMFQPQIDSLDGDILQGRAAVMVQGSEEAEPVFGAVWLESRISTDLDSREVLFEDLRVPRARFPDTSDEQEQALVGLLKREMPTWNLELSMDRLIPMLGLAEKQLMASKGFNDSPPEILFRQQPTVLVSIDGDPQLRPVPDSEIQAVVNTAFLIAHDPRNPGVYYLFAGADTWYKASEIRGPWAVTERVPAGIRQMQPEEEEAEPQDDAEGPSTPPAIVVTTGSAELIVTDGPPQYKPIAGGELLIVTNSESDVLRDLASQQIFVLLSGRWFTGASTDGPWELARPDQLPAGFAAIDPDGDYGYLLTWVAGTELAQEAVLDAAVPQTAAVKRDATIEVSFDGEPRFEPIDETDLYYAVNTESQVIRAGEQYFCAEQGVWYVADDPAGPWRVATEVPQEIQAIPASSPVYNTKYVHVFHSTPQVVYVGYFPGYTNSFIHWGVPVWGTGWWYHPWWGPSHFFPRHRTWGFHVRWNPWFGWGLGFSHSTGRFTFSIGWSTWGRSGWWGPWGWHGHRAGFHRGWHHGYRAGVRAGYRAGMRHSRQNAARNLYARGRNADRVARTGASPQAATAAATPMAATNQANNVFTDASGNVYRRQQDGAWQQRERGSWGGNVQAAGAQNMNRDFNARQRGAQRARSAPRGGGGGVRRRR